MAVFEVKSQYKIKINAAPEGAHARVHARASWDAYRPAKPAGSPTTVDPRAAGRRAAEKHADALRRLSD